MAKNKRRNNTPRLTFKEILSQVNPGEVPDVQVDPGEVPDVNKPDATKPRRPPKFSFSFRFFKQIENFGLSKASSSWFVSLLERLKDISENTLDEFLEIAEPSKGYRFHPINWAQPNIPIQQANLEWVDEMYLNENYPIYQIAISAGRGRVAGFLDENNIFNIVLLDHDHNLQPMKTKEYRVDPNDVVISEYDQLLHAKQKALRKKCTNGTCGVRRELVKSHVLKEINSVLICKFSEEDLERTSSLIDKGTVKTVEEIYQAGIEKLQ